MSMVKKPMAEPELDDVDDELALLGAYRSRSRDTSTTISR